MAEEAAPQASGTAETQPVQQSEAAQTPPRASRESREKPERSPQRTPRRSLGMRMDPATGEQSLLPAINRSSLVLFGGLALIVLNLFWVNGGSLVAAIFHPGSGEVQFTQLSDTGWQVLGLALLTIGAEYFGDNAGTAALLFIAALWILWLLTHFGTTPKEAAPTHTEANPQSNASSTTAGGSGGQKL